MAMLQILQSSIVLSEKILTEDFNLQRERIGENAAMSVDKDDEA